VQALACGYTPKVTVQTPLPSLSDSFITFSTLNQVV
jgi:hypothetical protein